MSKIEYLFADNFAGGGGASQGIEQAIGRAIDMAEAVTRVLIPEFCTTKRKTA